MSLWALKKQAVAAERAKPNKVNTAQLRAQKDVTELDLPKTMEALFPDPDDFLNFELVISPDEGLYRGGRFHFTFHIVPNYPYDPPKVQCTQKIYHPNIDLDGKICLNILREDWKPVLNLNSIAVGLQFLFLEPNPDDPLNKDAAEHLHKNSASFASQVRQCMQGGVFNGVSYDRVV